MASYRKAVILAGVLGLLSAGPALADSHEEAGAEPESQQVYGTNLVEAGPYVELDVPTEPWKYQTFYFFAATRGLVEEDLNATEKGFAMVGTITIDVVTLVGAAFAGLFG